MLKGQSGTLLETLRNMHEVRSVGAGERLPWRIETTY